MNTKFKLAAYAVLLCLVAWFGRGFYINYATTTRQSAEAATNDTASVETNNPVGTNNPVTTTNGSGTSNIVAIPTNQEVKLSNSPAGTNLAVAAPAPASPTHSASGTMVAYLGALIGTIIVLGSLIAYDFSHYVVGATVSAILDDKGEGMRDPEYERAEQVWANGKHLEAVEMMRDFLKKHPREQYAALRIAEIYEKDLNNPLAAALEYEEVLKKKLSAERWGWAAVHLCNLYSKLGQQDKARALLQRIVDEYPKTAAAKKARSHLGLPEPEPEHEPIVEAVAPAAKPRSPKEEEEEPAPAPPAPPKSNLPPGFRPKK
jgi:TolA-binding protein